MKPCVVAIAFIFIKTFTAAAVSDDGVEIRPGTKVNFASAAECARLLSARDTFVKSMSPFDRAARLKTDQDVSEAEYFAFVARQAKDWSADEKARLQAILASFRTKTEKLDLRFPASISLLKTSGLEEAMAAYCRGTSIVLPTQYLERDQAQLEHVICHELFHIYRGHYPDNRRALYKIIGFEVCPEIALPRELLPRKITNPDAPLIDSVIRIRVDGRRVPVTPVLFAKTDRYDTKAGGEFVRNMVFQLMVLDEVSGRFEPAMLPGGKPRLIDPSDAPDYLDQVGQNTNYIIHPEEILAENFVLMVQNAASVPSPKVVDEMRSLLTK